MNSPTQCIISISINQKPKTTQGTLLCFIVTYFGWPKELKYSNYHNIFLSTNHKIVCSKSCGFRLTKRDDYF